MSETSTTNTTTTMTLTAESYKHLSAGEMAPVPEGAPLPLPRPGSGPVLVIGRREDADAETEEAREAEATMISLADRVPDARGLEEIKDPFLKAKVADALDIGRDANAMRKLGEILSHRYPRASERVLKQADYLARVASR